jgi:hypothetical protein
MRLIMLAFTLVFAGCSAIPTKTVPAAPAARDGKTPIVLGKPIVWQRIQERRLQNAQVAQGKLTVEGQLVR